MNVRRLRSPLRGNMRRALYRLAIRSRPSVPSIVACTGADTGPNGFRERTAQRAAEALIDPVALVNVLLVIVTAVLTIFTYLLYRSAADGRDARKASAKAWTHRHKLPKP